MSNDKIVSISSGRYVKKDKEFNNLPSKKKPSVLDIETTLSTIDLMQHISDDHILKKLSLSIEQAKFIAYPASTAFLILTSVFSGFAGRSYKVARFDGDRHGIPLGLYVVAEQPSGSGKDFPIDLMVNCFSGSLRDFERQTKDSLGQAVDKIEKYIDSCGGEAPKKDPEYKALVDAASDIKKLLEAIENYSLDLSDSTPEGLEISLLDSGGHFTLASSEQELFDVFLCGLYSNGNSNKGLILKSFDGGGVKVKRAGRKGFKGIGAGSFTMFAQVGSLKKLYSSSGQTGLAERFLKLLEPNRGGRRDFVNGKNFNFYLIDELKELLDPILMSIINKENITEPRPFYDLSILNLSAQDYDLLNHFRNEMEQTVDIGGIYHDCKTDMLGTLTKCDLQVFKLASCLHLLDGGCYEPEIKQCHVISAINIIRDIFMSYRGLMEGQAIAGDKAAYEKIIDHLSKQSKPRTKVEVMQNLKGRSPFTMSGAYKYIGTIIDEMIDHDLLSEIIDKQTGITCLVVN